MNTLDIAVVGAGLAGLTAAREIAMSGRSVSVLEARERVGGRTSGQTLANGSTVEMGGQWVGPTQTAVLELISELGLETFPTYADGEDLTAVDGGVHRHGSESLGLPDANVEEVGRVMEELERMAGEVPQAAPWETAGARDLDRQTLESWLTAATDDEVARAFLRFLSRGLFAAEAHEMSLLHFLFYIRSGGGFEIMVSTRGGAQDSRIVGGSQRISERLAEELGEAVALQSPVRAVAQDDEGVTLAYDGGELRARRAIVALPPALAGRLTYTPALPARRDALTQQLPMGSVIKVQVAYESPFWRREGLSGQAFSLDDDVSIMWDNSPPDGSCGVLGGFIEASHARAAAELDVAARRALVLETLTRLFGPRASDPTEYVERDWMAEPFTRGCYGGRLGAGVWTAYGQALSERVGRLHWAGAETSDVWNGYMDGAVRSGHRAAAEALAALG